MMRRDPSYFHSVNPDLLQHIPLTARRVLELGCGTGALGARFRWRAPHVHWAAIEADPVAAAAARDCLDAVLEADIEALSDEALAAFTGDPVDVLVFGDVLEHLREPAVQLKRMAALLRPGGVVVACIPNIGHWTILLGLLRGDWTYRDSGLLDATHLRFYTRASALALLSGAGLVPRHVRSRDIPMDGAGQARFLEALRPVLPALGLDQGRTEDGLKALQYVIVAQKPPVTEPLHLHQTVMVRPLLEARVDPPWQAMATLPGVTAAQSDRDFTRAASPIPGAPKVMVWQRRLVGNADAWTASMRQLIAHGWVVVAEWDDHPDLLPGASRESWLRHPWVPMTSVHACQVSTPRLAEAFRPHQPEVAVFENALLECPPLPPKDPSVVRIIYAAVARPGAARLISPALDRVCDDPSVEIVVVGDEKVFASTRALRKVYRPLLSYAQYLALLETCDINLLPLRGEPAELCKSPLKFIESASRGVVCIASRCIYEDAIEHGRTGWIADGQEDFTRLLSHAVSDAAGRQAMAEAAWQVVRERHLQYGQVARRQAWYRDLSSRLGELNEALFQRHPELRP